MRDSESYIYDYLKRINALSELIPDLQVIVGEGDSRDTTHDLIRLEAPANVKVIDVTHGGIRYGSIDKEQRWKDIASAVTKVRDLSLKYNPKKLIWVEADLVWDADTMLRLLARTEIRNAVCPAVKAMGNPNFWYDSWGFRLNGGQFSSDPPFWSGPAYQSDGMVHIDSCGSCFALDLDDSRVFTPTSIAWWQKWDGIWPARCGGNLWLDPEVTIWHP
jgi:hypothetical protein